MATVELTKENFEQVVSTNPVVVVDFWAPWCGPCKGFAPIFEGASEQHQDVVFAKVNTDDEQEIAGTFGIRSIPTLMVFREKVLLFQQAGALPASAFEQVLEQAKALDMAQVHAEIAKRESAKRENSDGAGAHAGDA
ncbi:MAG: thioredoxin [Burkholderiales bacterium]